MTTRQALGVAGFIVMALVACGGSTSTVGSSGSPDCSLGACPAIGCAPGSISVTKPGTCCPTCEPAPGTCLAEDSCTNKKGCGTGFERFEYVPGCCECRRDGCAAVACAPFAGCGAGEHVDLAGCCPTCVKDDGACKDGASACSAFQCPAGYQGFSMPSDGPGCCSSCEVDPTYCKAEGDAYGRWLDVRLAEPLARACTVAEDCEITPLENACAADCGTAVAKAASAKIKQDAVAYGLTNCKHCPPPSIACVGIVLQPKCDGGKCAIAP